MITFLLLIIVVANTGPIVYRPLPVDTAGGKQKALDQRGFAASAVTCEGYITNLVGRFRSQSVSP